MRSVRVALALFVVLSSVAVIGIAINRLFSERDHPDLAPSATSSAGVRGLFVEPDDGREPVIAEIDAAASEIDVHIYLLTDNAVLDALDAAEARGVTVRVILEQYPFGGAGNPEAIADRLRRSGSEVKWASQDFSFSHVKTITVDRSVAIIMNLNLSQSSFEDNREFGIITTVPAEVESAQAVFVADWDGTDLSDPGSLIVSPLNSRSAMTEQIDSAEHSLDVYAEVIRDDEMIDRLVQSSARGVEVRIILSPDKDPVNRRILSDLGKAGIDVRYMAEPYVHAKLIIVDGRLAFIGSQNLTAMSLDENREVGIVVNEKEILERVATVFERDYAGSDLGSGAIQVQAFVVRCWQQRAGDIHKYSPAQPLDRASVYV